MLWFSTAGVDPGDVILYHYAAGWTPLATRQTQRDASYSYYEAPTSSFSLFAVGGQTKTQSKTAPVATTSNPASIGTAQAIADLASRFENPGAAGTTPAPEDSREQVNRINYKPYIGSIVLVVLVGLLGLFFWIRHHRSNLY